MAPLEAHGLCKVFPDASGASVSTPGKGNFITARAHNWKSIHSQMSLQCLSKLQELSVNLMITEDMISGTHDFSPRSRDFPGSMGWNVISVSGWLRQTSNYNKKLQVHFYSPWAEGSTWPPVMHAGGKILFLQAWPCPSVILSDMAVSGSLQIVLKYIHAYH